MVLILTVQNVPTAGAYVSLDPDWGSAHEEAWIINKSPYVQNVTTFGTACIGIKVDGDLHDGGNDSIVANDFTQIPSDGIGYWVTNSGRPRTCSCLHTIVYWIYLQRTVVRLLQTETTYGDFVPVAEGIDDTEVPVTGEVDNPTVRGNYKCTNRWCK